jgi:SOS-response transcriptional repressor LexA/DNA-binding XRE family transcriptional regulator
MPPTATKPKAASASPWAKAIFELRRKLQLDQTALGERLDCSAMTISRWERGAQEPPSHAYIELGNLAGDPDCWFFWSRAGLRNEDLMRVVPSLRRRLKKIAMPAFEIVAAGSGGKKPLRNKLQLVAIPLLKVVAASHGEKGHDASVLHDAPIESMIAAPKDWCPNPTATTCLRVKGHSMMPLIQDGYILAVDSSQSERNKLNGKIVIAWHRDMGLTVSRLQRYGHTDTLQPENREYESITLDSKHKWKVLAKVLWWIGKAP